MIIACVLAISSQVVRGHVGLSAIVPALQQLGHEVWPLPTVLLSNHPGHARFEPLRLGAGNLARMADVLADNGWLDQADAVLTGYLPSPAHVRMAGEIVRRMTARRAVTYLCDPVIGDEPKGMYIDPAAAAAIRDTLLPRADITTPNRFELAWLTGVSCETIDGVARAAAGLGPAITVVTSAQIADQRITSLMATGGDVHLCSAMHVPTAPHGTGDLFAGLLLGHRLNGDAPEAALGRAVAGVDAAIAASAGRDELDLTSLRTWYDAVAVPVKLRARDV